MIISCPQCGTAYDVPDGSNFVGRKVRCKACQSVWRVESASPPPVAQAAQAWVEPMPRGTVGRGDPAPTAVPQRHLTAVPSPIAESDAPRSAAISAGSPAGAPSAIKTATKAIEAGAAADWPDWAANGVAQAPPIRTAAAAAGSAEAAAAAESSRSDTDAVPQSMSASLERRRQARQRSGFDDVEAALAAVRTVPAPDERDRPYRALALQSAKPVRDSFAEPDYGGEAESDGDNDAPIDAARASRAGLIVGWVALLASLGGLASFVYAGAEVVVRMLPGAAPLYAALGMPVNARGLEFQEIAYEWKLDPRGKPVIGISGKVTNVSKEPRQVSSVVFAFIDQDGLELFDWATSIRAKALQPGSSLPFASVVPVPADAVRKVEVRFAKPRRGQ